MNKITHSTLLAKIRNYPPQPIEMFKQILERVQTKGILMHLATVDDEFGVLNRSVMYRGIIDNCWICFVTERNSRKYENLLKNPKLSLTLLLFLEDGKTADNKVVRETWHVRLLDATAEELGEEHLQKLWQEEPLFAKIRSQVSECGKPCDPEETEARYKAFLKTIKCANAENLLIEHTETYTGFKIFSKCWDFYKSEPGKIADRIQYKLVQHDQWKVNHVQA